MTVKVKERGYRYLKVPIDVDVSHASALSNLTESNTEINLTGSTSRTSLFRVILTPGAATPRSHLASTEPHLSAQGY